MLCVKQGGIKYQFLRLCMTRPRIETRWILYSLSQWLGFEKVMFYDFEVYRNTTEATKNICYAKGENAVDDSKVIKWFKKFRSGSKNLDYQARSGRFKTLDSEAVHQATEENVSSNSRRISGEHVHSSVWFVICTTPKNLSKAAKLWLMLQKYRKIFHSPKSLHAGLMP